MLGCFLLQSVRTSTLAVVPPAANSKTRAQLAGREVITLIHEFRLVRRCPQPDVVQADVTCYGVRCLGGRLDLDDRMQTREAIDEDDTWQQRYLQDSQANQAIRDVGRKVAPAALRDGAPG